MTAEILTTLRDKRAFRPKPPEHELASVHVPVTEVGIPHAIDDHVLLAMMHEDEAMTLIIGPSGSGKSSLLASATSKAVSDLDATPIPLPLKVPVAHHLERLDAMVLIKGITQSLAMILVPVLSDTDRSTLERQLATTLTTTRQAPTVTAGASGGPSFLTVTAAIELAGDLVTMTSRPEWMDGGPVDALSALADLAAAYGVSLVVIFDDTDVWSVGDPAMAKRARSFFSALRVLQDCAAVRLIVSIQTRWTEPADDASPEIAAARREYRELAERADSTLAVPLAATDSQGRDLITAIINRRIEIALPSTTPPADGWASSLFTDEALDLLAFRCVQGNIRAAVVVIRDALDHVEQMPELITRDHLLDVIAE